VILDMRRLLEAQHHRVAINLVGVFASTLMLSLAGVAAVATLLPRSTVTVVASGSMRPALREGDVLVYRAADIASVGKGTVVVVDGDGQRIVHRVVDVRAGGSLVTKGDANASVDTFAVSQRELEGTGVVLVPWIGLPRVWWQQRQFIPLIATAVVLVAALLSCRVNAHMGPRPPTQRPATPAVAWLFRDPPMPSRLLPTEFRLEILRQSQATRT
jgi:signal peptidase